MAKKLNDSSIPTVDSTGLTGKLLVLTDGNGKIYKVSPSEFLKLAGSSSPSSGSGGGSTPSTQQLILGAGIDSFTYGAGASDAYHAYINVLTRTLFATSSINAGIPGAVLQNTNHHSGNFFDRYQSDFGGKGITQVFLLAGYNDSFYGSALCQSMYPSYYDAALTLDAFKTQMDTVVKWLITNVVSAPDKIILGSMPRHKSTLFQGTNGAALFELQKQYHLEIGRIAFNNGCKFAPVFDYMWGNGGDLLVSSDRIHANDTGHNAIAQSFLNATVLSSIPAPLYPTPTGTPTNLALNKPTSAHSTLAPSYSPDKAVDGNRSADNTSSYLSGGTGTDEWWQVDLQAQHALSFVRLYIIPGYESMFANAQILASNSQDGSSNPLAVVSSPETIASGTTYVDVPLGNFPNARYVRIRPTVAGNYQDFPEVEVWGY